MKPSRARHLLSVLKPIYKLSKKKQNQFVKCCDNSTLNCICECAKNVLKGNVRLTPVQLTKLKKYKKAVRELSLKTTSPKKKRILLQRGGFLSALIGPAIGLLTSLFTRN